MDTKTLQDFSWEIIDTYFKENPNNLVAHHLDSYNSFFEIGIPRIFRENNPIRFIEKEKGVEKGKEENGEGEGEKRNECYLYLGGKKGDKIYYGKPILYDEDNETSSYLYPNDARLRNLTYGVTIHYDVEVDFVYYQMGAGAKMEKVEESTVIEQMYLGKFPIMLQSNLCILQHLDRNVRFNMGECRNDYGGYFIIDGKEKVIIPQEKFADNMIYTRKHPDKDKFLYSTNIRSVSENSSKPIRQCSVKIIAPTSRLSNLQLVVDVANVKKPVPLFILMRALGIESDLDIIQLCLLNLEIPEQAFLQDLFIPSIHEASALGIFNQQTALYYMAELTKHGTVSGVMEILSDYFLAHVGELCFIDKGYFLGYMTYQLLRVYSKQQEPTDRDSFLYKRMETSGALLYDLFREYYLIQKKDIAQKIDKEYYFQTLQKKGDKDGDEDEEEKVGVGVGVGEKMDTNTDAREYITHFPNLLKKKENYQFYFKERMVEQGFKKAFKGNWGSQAYTKRLGVVQDLNRLSWNSCISHLRKTNLPFDSSAKVTGPRLLNATQWGVIDPIDTPDGGNCGLHKHLAIMTYITTHNSEKDLIDWLYKNYIIQRLHSCSPAKLYYLTKLFVNGNWIGSVKNANEMYDTLKLAKHNGIIPVHASVAFNYSTNVLYIYTDGGRLLRPIYYIQQGRLSCEPYLYKNTNASWKTLLQGLNVEHYTLYQNMDQELKQLKKKQSCIEYIDVSEEETAYIATSLEDLQHSIYGDINVDKNVDAKEDVDVDVDVKEKSNKKPTPTPTPTHLELEPSTLYGVMGNQVIFLPHNPIARNCFSCGQSKQAVSVYHSNSQMRMDKTGVLLNYGQSPLIQSRYLEYINKCEQPYGVNTIVAIMSYNGYNVEDAILVNEGSVQRGLFNTTYYSTYEDREESAKISGNTNSKFANVNDFQDIKLKQNKNGILDYHYLDENGLIKEGTEVQDDMILIGKLVSSTDTPNQWNDSSTKPKKGQLGVVDKTFVTNKASGSNIAKVRIRDTRIPSIGDKMASRAGQKGTIGLLIPEMDMPFTAEGIRPDLIINPHALPSRQTLGQLIECIFGKVCCLYGGLGDCTAFQMKGSNYSTFAPWLLEAGLSYTGDEILYNGLNGSPLNADIYIGPTYYMRLKHMVKDKINYRARGPNAQLTRQPVQGRANDGGLRIGEMERDGVIGHGMAAFLNDSFLTRGDDFMMGVCNKTGTICVYNPAQQLFLSSYADGPLRFVTNLEGEKNIVNVSKFGRSFSLVRIPYSFKLLIHELQALNVQLRIITDKNVNNVLNLMYPNQFVELTGAKDYATALAKFKQEMNILQEDVRKQPFENPLYSYTNSNTYKNPNINENMNANTFMDVDFETVKDVKENVKENVVKDAAEDSNVDSTVEDSTVNNDWSKVWSKNKQAYYWFNNKTGESSWKEPIKKPSSLAILESEEVQKEQEEENKKIEEQLKLEGGGEDVEDGDVNVKKEDDNKVVERKEDGVKEIVDGSKREEKNDDKNDDKNVEKEANVKHITFNS